MAALVAIQRPELFNGVVFSAPAILPAAGAILVCINNLAITVMMCYLAWRSSCYCFLCFTIGSTESGPQHHIKNPRRGTLHKCIHNVHVCHTLLLVTWNMLMALKFEDRKSLSKIIPI